MRTLLLLAALSVTAPTTAEEQAVNARLCRSANTPPGSRAEACRRSLAAGRLTRIELARTYYARGLAHGDLRKSAAAITDFNNAIRLDPVFANAYHARGKLHEAGARYRQAVQDFESAIRFVPDFAAALNSLAWLLATAPDATVRNGPRAIRAARRAVSLVAYPEHRDTLAAALAEAGRFKDAVAMQQAAISHLRETGRVLLLSAYERRLALYRAGRPFRR